MKSTDTIPTPSVPKPTNVRYQVIAVSILMAFILYLDRVCMSEIVKSDSFRADFPYPKEQVGKVLGAFFFTYALLQIPSGWASDRFGARRMLTIYIACWSLMTGLTGWVGGLIGLLFARLVFGAAQAGAYPTSSGIVRKWFPMEQRGFASSLVSVGGRLGGTLAPYITTLCILQLGSWRTVLSIYCFAGLIIAALYWIVVRDTPQTHTFVNAVELNLIANDRNAEPKQQKQDFFQLLIRCSSSFSLWMNSIAQFSINFGWVFLITWLPSYLTDTHKVDPLQGAKMVTFVLATGMAGMLFGGWASDQSMKRFGKRWGRGVPLALSCLCAGLAYMTCPFLSGVWPVVFCCAVVAFMTDLGNPSNWAFLQDIGGRSTSAVYGWGNMWGNLGASASAVLIPMIQQWSENAGLGASTVFVVCGSCFVIASLAALGMDSRKELEMTSTQT